MEKRTTKNETSLPATLRHCASARFSYRKRSAAQSLRVAVDNASVRPTSSWFSPTLREIFPEGLSRENRGKTNASNSKCGIRSAECHEVRTVGIQSPVILTVNLVEIFPQGQTRENRGETDGQLSRSHSRLSLRERRLLGESYRLIFWKYFQKPKPEKIVGKRMADTRDLTVAFCSAKVDSCEVSPNWRSRPTSFFAQAFHDGNHERRQIAGLTAGD